MENLWYEFNPDLYVACVAEERDSLTYISAMSRSLSKRMEVPDRLSLLRTDMLAKTWLPEAEIKDQHKSYYCQERDEKED